MRDKRYMAVTIAAPDAMRCRVRCLASRARYARRKHHTAANPNTAQVIPRPFFPMATPVRYGEPSIP